MAGTTRTPRSIGLADRYMDDVTASVAALVVDMELLRAVVAEENILAEELHDDHAIVRTWLVEVDADENNIANHLDYGLTPNGVIGGSYAFSAGAATTLAATGFITYRLNGIEYSGPMPATITLEDLGDVTQNNFAAWRIEIDALGAVTAKESPTAAGYATAQIALLALGGLAPTANTVTIGYLTLTDTDSVIALGTDNLNAAGVVSAIYYERGPRKRISGLNAALGAASTLTAASTTFGHGTINANMNGLKKAQIGAGATQALTDADVISTLKFGAVVILTDLAGTAYVSLNQAGIPGVQTMASASAAAALALIDAVIDRLPAMFVPVALIRVSNQAGGDFTFKTTNWDATSVTSTITDAAVAGWDRTVAAGFNSHQITRVAIPADIAAPVVGTISASKPTSSNVDAAGDLTGFTVTLDG